MTHTYKYSMYAPLHCLTSSTLSSDTRGHPALFPLQRHPIVWNCWYQRLMLMGDGGSLLNCRRTARWTETTDSCFTKCSTQNAFCSGVAIIVLFRHRPREKRGVGLRMRTKLEHLLFHSIWETYFCVRFKNRNGRLKPLQSFWYTLYNITATCFDLWQSSSGRPKNRLTFYRFYFVHLWSHMPYSV